MKTKEELNVLKSEVENMNKKLTELSDGELEQISGGSDNIKGQEMWWRNNPTFLAGH